MPIALKDSQVSVRLPIDLKDRMETYAHLTGRTKSYVAMEALSAYLDWRIPQIEDLKEAVLAADAGEFASETDVAQVMAKYGVKKTLGGASSKSARRRAA